MRRLTLGVGCQRGASAAELETLVHRTLSAHALEAAAIALLCSIDTKADEPAVQALARRLDVPTRFYPATRLERETPRLVSPSDAVFRVTGCHGVAESAALAAAGGGGALLVPKQASRRATCAIALLGSA